MCRISQIVLLAVAPALAQGGGHFHAGYASQYAPSVGKPVTAATSGYYRPAPRRAPVSSTPVQVNAGGFTPDQLAFLERKKMETGRTSHGSTASSYRSTGYDRPARMSSWDRPSRSVSPSRDGGYSARYAPSYQEGPRMLAATETTPGVLTVLVAAVVGVLAGSALNLYAARLRRASPTFVALLG